MDLGKYSENMSYEALHNIYGNPNFRRRIHASFAYAYPPEMMRYMSPRDNFQNKEQN